MSEAPVAKLDIRNVSRDFDGRRVVDDVSLQLQAGEVACLLGPSGCGKSTTLRMAAGIETLDTGEIFINGVRVAGPGTMVPPEHRGVGLMFQDFALFPHLTVAQNVAFGLPRSQTDRTAIVQELLDSVGLAKFADVYPHQLSGGEQQRVALMRALAPKPSIILMDEPFSGLDNRLRDSVRDDTFKLLRAQGTSVLLVTHEPEEAMRVADRIALMRAGRIIRVGAPYNIYNTPVDTQAAAFFSDINVIAGIVQGAQIETPFGKFLAPGHGDGSNVEIVVRPQHLKLDFDRQGKGPLPTESDGVPARGSVVRARFIGNESIVDLAMDHDGSILTASIPAVFMPQLGTPMWLSLRRDRCFVFKKP